MYHLRGKKAGSMIKYNKEKESCLSYGKEKEEK